MALRIPGFGKHISDFDLIEALRSGEETKENWVMKILYKKLKSKVIGLLRRDRATMEEAEDAFQEALLAVFQYAQDDKFLKQTALEAFVKSVALRYHRGIRRQEENRARLLEEWIETEHNLSPSPRFQTPVESIECRKIALGIFSKLGASCAKLLKQYVYYQASTKEIADTFYKGKKQTARQMRYQCWNKLKNHLNAEPAQKDLLATLLIKT